MNCACILARLKWAMETAIEAVRTGARHAGEDPQKEKEKEL
jgi:hypothetical protein